MENEYPHAWLALLTGLAVAIAATVDRHVLPLLAPWGWPVVAVFAAVVGFAVTVGQMDRRENGPWATILLFRLAVLLGAGGWAGWVDWHGLTVSACMVLAVATVALTGLGALLPMPAPGAGGLAAKDRRNALIREWEERIRKVTRQDITVTGYEPWPNPDDGFRLHMALPEDSGMTDADLAPFCPRLAASARLKPGCVIQPLPGDQQGLAYLDVMTRDNLTDSDDAIHVEPTHPASINDPFPVMRTPRGVLLEICLRVHALLIGGAPDSGKTTLLNRIIMRLARCTDALLWIADYNGGGVGNPWVEPWARGEAAAPIPDWIADTPEEMAVMVAVAAEVARDRKHNPEARRRKRALNVNLLPVDASLPAIIVLADEGGEIRQDLSPLGLFAANTLSRLSQIGRAEGVRPLMSILRGTSDLTDKAHRVMCALRICLRMNELDEYAHVLATRTPRVELTHPGSGYLKTPALAEPVYGRTANVDEDSITRHAIACAHLRPRLDDHARAVAARLTPAMVTGGKDYPHLRGSRIMRDVAAGRAYEGRWERFAARLAEMRGEEYEPEPSPATNTGQAAGTGSALDRLEAAYAPRTPVEAPVSGGKVYEFPPQTAREQILALIQERPGITASEIEMQVQGARSRVYDLLRALQFAGQISKTDDGYVPRYTGERESAR